MHDVERDFDAFQESLRASASDFFSSAAPVYIARAPGRLDVMGGIADYSGSLVAEMPIAQAALVGAQVNASDEGVVTVRSLNAAAHGLTETVELASDLFINPVSLLKRLRDSPPAIHWAGYIAGCLSLLRAEGLVPRKATARLLLCSSVPIGAGVASSAAIEVASMRALCAAFGVHLDGMALARLCQRVENEIMDAPCGIMDQVTAAMGKAGELLLLKCQPHEVQGTIALPQGWSVFGINSGVKHSVGGVAYTRVRVAAFMGFKMLAERAGRGFGGYLCNISPEEYHHLCPEELPETISGAVFLGAHGGIFDTVTTVDPAETYPVRAATEHAIYENARVNRFVEALRNGDDFAMTLAGRQMAGSHESYSRCGLGSGETDRLVHIGQDFDSIVGAKITGGGSGGTVCFLCRSQGLAETARDIAERYQSETGLQPQIIQGTSPGTMMTEVRRI